VQRHGVRRGFLHFDRAPVIYVYFVATLAAPPGRMLNPSGFLGQQRGAGLNGVTGAGQAAAEVLQGTEAPTQEPSELVRLSQNSL